VTPPIRVTCPLALAHAKASDTGEPDWWVRPNGVPAADRMIEKVSGTVFEFVIESSHDETLELALATRTLRADGWRAVIVTDAAGSGEVSDAALSLAPGARAQVYVKVTFAAPSPSQVLVVLEARGRGIVAEGELLFFPVAS
jgi:hypothetical protein